MNLPDVNVWIALAHQAHPHHPEAVRWLERIDHDGDIAFCRPSQVGFLRVLTIVAPGGGRALTQNQAWRAYDAFLQDSRVIFMEEPAGLDSAFRRFSSGDEISPKRWADDYLVAFAHTANMSLVTFDQALAARAAGAILLRADAIQK